MQVKRVTQNDLDETYCCMSGLPLGHSWREALPEARKWFKANLGKYVEGYHVLDGEKVVGLMYWARSETVLAPYIIEPKVAFIYCTEVIKDYSHKGYGRALFDYAKDDLKKREFKGMLVDATDIKEFMYYEDFVKQGFKTIKEHPPFKLMYFPLTKANVEYQMKELNYQPSKDKVEVTFFTDGFCPVGVSMYRMMKKVAQGFGEQIRVVEIEATPETARKYGTLEPLINGKIKIFGPAKEEDIKKAIQEEVDQLKR
jgi:ribosomal protein S18 acetylase RimI-like enzyme